MSDMWRSSEFDSRRRISSTDLEWNTPQNSWAETVELPSGDVLERNRETGYVSLKVQNEFGDQLGSFALGVQDRDEILQTVQSEDGKRELLDNARFKGYRNSAPEDLVRSKALTFDESADPDELWQPGEVEWNEAHTHNGAHGLFHSSGTLPDGSAVSIKSRGGKATINVYQQNGRVREFTVPGGDLKEVQSLASDIGKSSSLDELPEGIEDVTAPVPEENLARLNMGSELAEDSVGGEEAPAEDSGGGEEAKGSPGDGKTNGVSKGDNVTGTDKDGNEMSGTIDGWSFGRPTMDGKVVYDPKKTSSRKAEFEDPRDADDQATNTLKSEQGAPSQSLPEVMENAILEYGADTSDEDDVAEALDNYLGEHPELYDQFDEADIQASYNFYAYEGGAFSAPKTSSRKKKDVRLANVKSKTPEFEAFRSWLVSSYPKMTARTALAQFDNHAVDYEIGNSTSLAKHAVKEELKKRVAFDDQPWGDPNAILNGDVDATAGKEYDDDDYDDEEIEIITPGSRPLAKKKTARRARRKVAAPLSDWQHDDRGYWTPDPEGGDDYTMDQGPGGIILNRGGEQLGNYGDDPEAAAMEIEREHFTSKKRARRKVASVPNWAVDVSGTPVQVGQSYYNPETETAAEAMKITEEGPVDPLSGDTMSWGDLQEGWPKNLQKVGRKTARIRKGASVRVAKGRYRGMIGRVTDFSEDLVDIRVGRATVIATPAEIRLIARKKTAFKVGDEVYINAPVSAYSDVDDQYGKIVKINEVNEGQYEYHVQTEDGEMVAITPKYLEMHIEATKSARRKTAGVPDWAVDSDGQKLQVGQKYNTDDPEGETSTLVVTDGGARDEEFGDDFSWDDLYTEFNPDGNDARWQPSAWAKSSSKTSAFQVGDRVLYTGDALAPQGIPGVIEDIDGDTYSVSYDEEAGGGFANASESELKELKKSSRRSSGLFDWNKGISWGYDILPGTGGASNSKMMLGDAAGYYFSIDAYDPNRVGLDWTKDGQDYYYDAKSVEEAKEYAEKVVQGQEVGTRLSRKKTASGVPSWAVDAEGQRLEVDKLYYDPSVDDISEAGEVTDTGIITPGGYEIRWVDLKDDWSNGLVKVSSKGRGTPKA